MSTWLWSLQRGKYLRKSETVRASHVPEMKAAQGNILPVEIKQSWPSLLPTPAVVSVSHSKVRFQGGV